MGNRSGMFSGATQVGYSYTGRNQLATVVTGEGLLAGYMHTDAP
jgi:hypothetical protein